MARGSAILSKISRIGRACPAGGTGVKAAILGPLGRAFVLIVALTLPVIPAQAEKRPRTPEAIVTEFQARLLDEMKRAAASTFHDRYERLLPAVQSAFHLRVMAQIAVGRQYWGKADDGMRDNLVRAFHRSSVATLATFFDTYDGEQFEFVGKKPGPQGTDLVRTNIVFKDRKPVELTYVAKRFKGDHYLIDVLVDGGISELNVRRSEYSRVLRTQGLAQLIATLNGKADELLATNP